MQTIVSVCTIGWTIGTDHWYVTLQIIRYTSADCAHAEQFISIPGRYTSQKLPNRIAQFP